MKRNNFMQAGDSWFHQLKGALGLNKVRDEDMTDTLIEGRVATVLKDIAEEAVREGSVRAPSERIATIRTAQHLYPLITSKELPLEALLRENVRIERHREQIAKFCKKVAA